MNGAGDFNDGRNDGRDLRHVHHDDLRHDLDSRRHDLDIHRHVRHGFRNGHGDSELLHQELFRCTNAPKVHAVKATYASIPRHSTTRSLHRNTAREQPRLVRLLELPVSEWVSVPLHLEKQSFDLLRLPVTVP